MDIFEGYNPYAKKRLEQTCMPDNEDLNFLEEVAQIKTKSAITEDVKNRLIEIEDGIAEIDRFNEKIDTNDENDYRLIIISEHIQTLLQNARKKIGILTEGSITNYKRNKLKQALLENPLRPAHYDWEKEFMLFYPEDYNRKLQPQGNWIMITENMSYVESGPEKYGIYYATPLAKETRQYGENYKYWYASILVNNREVCIEPREYVVIHDANLLLENIGKGIEMVEGSSSAKLDKNKVFYLKSRGFNQAEIYQILFKSVTNKNFCHFRVDPTVANIFDSIQQGMRIDLAIRVEEHRNNLPNFKFGEIC